MRWASEMSTPWGLPVFEDRLRMAAHFVAADFGLSRGQTCWANSPLPHPRASARSSTSETKARSMRDENSSMRHILWRFGLSDPRAHRKEFLAPCQGLPSVSNQSVFDFEGIHAPDLAAPFVSGKSRSFNQGSLPARLMSAATMLRQPLAALAGHVIFLQAAVGFAAEGHFDLSGRLRIAAPRGSSRLASPSAVRRLEA